jgi:hypothetical protein
MHYLLGSESLERVAASAHPRVAARPDLLNIGPRSRAGKPFAQIRYTI